MAAIGRRFLFFDGILILHLTYFPDVLDRHPATAKATGIALKMILTSYKSSQREAKYRVNTFNIYQYIIF